MTPEMRKAVWSKAFNAKTYPFNTTKSKLTDPPRPTEQNPPDHTKSKSTPLPSDSYQSGNPSLDNFIEEVLQTVEPRTGPPETPSTTNSQSSQNKLKQNEILKSIFGQIQTLFNDLSYHIKQSPLASFVPELQSTLNKMDAFLQNGNKSVPIVASTHRSYAQAVAANDDSGFELVQNPKKRHRSTSTSNITT